MDNPRELVEAMIDSGDLEALIRKAGELHGHFCSYLSLGVRAGYIALKKLGVRTRGMEDILAILETNNCFSDGVQMATGCTFGNNALIYRDLGKTAFTLARRDGNGIRIIVKEGVRAMFQKNYPEHRKLFEKVVVLRQGSPQEREKMMELATKICFDLTRIDAELLFASKMVHVEIPEYAPIFESVVCSRCKEVVMKPRARDKNGELLCIDCADEMYYSLDGEGIKQRGIRVEEKFTHSPVGYVESKFRDTQDPERMREEKSTIVILPEFSEGLFEIEQNEKIEVIFCFHKSESFTLKQKTRSGNLRGVFACRSPKRPNKIGLSCVRLLQREGNRLVVRGLDAIDGTPVLDIKPHLKNLEYSGGKK